MQLGILRQGPVDRISHRDSRNRRVLVVPLRVQSEIDAYQSSTLYDRNAIQITTTDSMQ